MRGQSDHGTDREDRQQDRHLRQEKYPRRRRDVVHGNEAGVYPRCRRIAAQCWGLDLHNVRSIITGVNDALPRLSHTEHIILELLLEDDELFGLQIVERSKGAVKRGTVYVTLGRMQDKGYVESRSEPPAPGAIGLPRRLYRPTAYGAAVVKTWTRAARALARLKPVDV